MLSSNNKLTKYVGYMLIGFFLLIIVLSFGMPDMGFSCSDPSTIVRVNKEDYHYIEFNKYVHLMYGSIQNEQMADFMLNAFIRDVLVKQKAEEEGITFSEDRISRLIQTSPEFVNPQTGKYNYGYFQLWLKQSNLNLEEFTKIYTRIRSRDELFFFMGLGNAIPSEDAKFKAIVDASRIQIKYVLLSNDDLRKRYAGEIAVSDQEIDSEIAAKNVTISDPNTDRERIKKQLESSKLEKLKNDIVEKINSIATAGGSFDSAAAVLKGSVMKSAPFKIGEEIKSDDKEGKSLANISSSGIFSDRILVMNINSTSPVINSVSGLYIFTPIVRELPRNDMDEAVAKKAESDVSASMLNAARGNLIRDMYENSKITKKSKTD